jgi:hypothetical protein
VIGSRTGNLSDVVKKAGEQQHVRPLNPCQVRFGFDDSLDRMPIHGVPMQWIVLRLCPNRFPVLDPARNEAGQIKCLPHRKQVLSSPKHVEERIPRLVRPGSLDRRRVLAEVLCGYRRDYEAAAGGQSASVQGNQRRRGLRLPIQTYLTLMNDQTVGLVAVNRPSLAAAEAQHASLREHLAGGPDRQVECMSDPPCRKRDFTTQPISVGEAKPLGHRGRLTRKQTVERST